MSELKAYTPKELVMQGRHNEPIYLKSEADKVIAKLKAKLESAQASMYADNVDLGMENYRLKRALWLARAERAHAEWGHWATIWFCNTNVELNINKSSASQDPYRCTTKRNAAIWRNIWHDVERKCRAKAEEYR